MPMRLAPAAPAKAPLGMAWAGKAEPRSTTKNPTTPATTATMVPDLPGIGHEAREHQATAPSPVDADPHRRIGGVLRPTWRAGRGTDGRPGDEVAPGT